MLSRSLVIHRTPDESARPAPARPVNERLAVEVPRAGRVWGKALVLAGLTALLLTFLLLNRTRVIEPKVQLLFLDFEHPRLLPVLALTSALSIACAAACRGLVHARQELNDHHGRSRTADLKREASRIEHAARVRAEAVASSALN